MFTILIPHVCKNYDNLRYLVSQLSNFAFVERIVVLECISEIKDNNYSSGINFPENVEIANIPNPFSISSVIKKSLDSLSSDFVAVIPDCFVFSNNIIDSVVNCFAQDSQSLVIFNRDNNVCLSDRNQVSDNFNIYRIYDQLPRIEDFENCFFVSKDLLHNILDERANSVYSLSSHFFVRFLSDQTKKNNQKVTYLVNERLYFDSNFLFNIKKELSHDKKLAEQYGIISGLALSFFQKFFSITESNKHKVITILGLSIKYKIRKKVSFSSDCVEYENIKKEREFRKKRACIFAGFTNKGLISDNCLRYLQHIKKEVDYLVYVADSKASKQTISILNELCDAVVIKRHCEYDFGSYKIGFKILEENGIIDNIDHLLVCNDSVDFVGEDKDLSILFDRSSDFDAFSLCMATYGFGKRIKRHKYEWTKNPHLQSYFLILNKKVFTNVKFKEFIQSVKHLRNKTEIIKQYEMGLSELLKKEEYKLGSYYPYDDNNIVNPYAIYLNEYVEHPILLKHMLKKN